MGCDIHMFVERKIDGTWTSALERTRNEYYDRYPEEEREWQLPDFYDGRSYDLFSILANVRNGYGFAGVPTGEGFRPIAMPRGLPADVSPEVKEESDRWNGDGHSHSYFTVAELLGYDWTQTATKIGILSAREFIEWDRYDRSRARSPKSWCGGISGPKVRHIDASEMERLCADIDRYMRPEALTEEMQRRGLADTYAQFHWQIPYHRTCSEFWSETVPRLLALGAQEDVRIVFWFDN